MEIDWARKRTIPKAPPNSSEFCALNPVSDAADLNELMYPSPALCRWP